MTALNIDRQGDGMKSTNSEESVISDLTLKFKGNCRQQQSTDHRHISFSQNPLSRSEANTSQSKRHSDSIY